MKRIHSGEDLGSQPKVDEAAQAIASGAIPAHIRLFNRANECVYDNEQTAGVSLEQWFAQHMKENFRIEVTGTMIGSALTENPQ